jgi:hypothetical protein
MPHPATPNSGLTTLRAREALGEGALIELCARSAQLQPRLSLRR